MTGPDAQTPEQRHHEPRRRQEQQRVLVLFRREGCHGVLMRNFQLSASGRSESCDYIPACVTSFGLR